MAKKLLLLLLLGMSPLSSPALAAEAGPYLAVHGGGVLLDESKNSDELGTFHLSFDAGPTASVAIGYDLGDKHPRVGTGRLELEASYRGNDLEEADFVEGKVPAEGEMTASAIMINTFGELRDKPPWIPYAGFGLGYAVLEMKEASISGAALVDDDDGVFAYQFGAGVGFRPGHSWTVDLGYRLFGTARPKFATVDGGTLRGEYLSHAVTLGLRLTF